MVTVMSEEDDGVGLLGSRVLAEVLSEVAEGDEELISGCLGISGASVVDRALQF